MPTLHLDSHNLPAHGSISVSVGVAVRVGVSVSAGVSVSVSVSVVVWASKCIDIKFISSPEIFASLICDIEGQIKSGFIKGKL